MHLVPLKLSVVELHHGPSDIFYKCHFKIKSNDFHCFWDLIFKILNLCLRFLAEMLNV